MLTREKEGVQVKVQQT